MENKRQTRTYTPEFKLEAVRLSQQPGSAVAGVARNLGVPLSVLQGWRRQHRDQSLTGSGHGAALPVDQEARIRQLERDLEIARQEGDILKKAVAFFAKESK